MRECDTTTWILEYDHGTMTFDNSRKCYQFYEELVEKGKNAVIYEKRTIVQKVKPLWNDLT